MTEIILSNVNVYAAIAEEAFAEMEKRLEEGRKPRSDGEGWVLSFDPSQKSFKNALTSFVMRRTKCAIVLPTKTERKLLR